MTEARDAAGVPISSSYAPLPWRVSENGHRVLDRDGYVVMYSGLSMLDAEQRKILERIVRLANDEERARLKREKESES